MLELAGSVGLGVDVADFLELECAFHGDGPHGAAAQEQGVVLFGKALGQLPDGVVHLQHVLDAAGHVVELLHDA